MVGWAYIFSASTILRIHHEIKTLMHSKDDRDNKSVWENLPFLKT